MTESKLPRCEFDRKDLILRLDMNIAAKVEEIAPAIDRLMEITASMGCAVGKDFEIKTALQEALVNAVVHGARHDPEKMVQLCVACDESRGMLIVVRDPGEGFDPSKIASPVVGQNIYSESGRGIYLINQLMDEVRFERGGTEIHMLKK